MEKKKITLWLLGSNASGKTTQAKKLHSLFGTSQPKFNEFVLNGQKCCYTEFKGGIANVGWVKDNQCAGTDSLATREKIEQSYTRALLSPSTKIVIVDGIMATGRWVDFLKNDKSLLFVVLLDFESVITNAKRIQQRRAAKDGGVIKPLDEKTLKNIEGKIKNFRRMFERVSEVADLNMSINARQDIEEIHSQICAGINKLFVW